LRKLLFTAKFSPKNEIGPRPVCAELTSLARPRSGPKPKTACGPLALRPRSPCQAAMRPETEISPAARSRSARPRSRPQPGPGPGKFHPAWAESRSGECEQFISIQRLCEVFGRTKPRSGSVAQTLAPFLFSFASSRVPQRRLRATDERRRRERARGAALSPSPVCALTVG
jgi:hypothetical protein